MEDKFGDRNIDQEFNILDYCNECRLPIAKLIGRGFALRIVSNLLVEDRIKINSDGNIVITDAGKEYLGVLRNWKEL